MTNGQPLAANVLAFGSRTCVGNEVKVVFGGQVMLHAKLCIDEDATPIAVDFLNLAGPTKGTISRGIMEWNGEEARFLMAAPGQPRPEGFADTATGTFSQMAAQGLISPTPPMTALLLWMDPGGRSGAPSHSDLWP